MKKNEQGSHEKFNTVLQLPLDKKVLFKATYSATTYTSKPQDIPSLPKTAALRFFYKPTGKLPVLMPNYRSSERR